MKSEHGTRHAFRDKTWKTRTTTLLSSEKSWTEREKLSEKKVELLWRKTYEHGPDTYKNKTIDMQNTRCLVHVPVWYSNSSTGIPVRVSYEYHVIQSTYDMYSYFTCVWYSSTGIVYTSMVCTIQSTSTQHVLDIHQHDNRIACGGWGNKPNCSEGGGLFRRRR